MTSLPWSYPIFVLSRQRPNGFYSYWVSDSDQSESKKYWEDEFWQRTDLVFDGFADLAEASRFADAFTKVIRLCRR